MGGTSLDRTLEAAEVERRLYVALAVTGIRQTDLAAKVGISQARLRHYLTGRTVPNAKLASRIADALGTSVELLWPAEPEVA